LNASTQTWVEIQSLLAEYWASVDRVGDVRRPAASFYADNGEMRLGSLEVRGRAAVEDFFRAREAREVANKRTTRHVLANLRVEEDGPDRITACALMLVYSGTGSWPLPSAAPSAVGDFEFRCILEAQAGWLLERVSGTSVFVGADAPAFAK
jgi:hypothetical protein